MRIGIEVFCQALRSISYGTSSPRTKEYYVLKLAAAKFNHDVVGDGREPRIANQRQTKCMVLFVAMGGSSVSHRDYFVRVKCVDDCGNGFDRHGWADSRGIGTAMSPAVITDTRVKTKSGCLGRCIAVLDCSPPDSLSAPQMHSQNDQLRGCSVFVIASPL